MFEEKFNVDTIISTSESCVHLVASGCGDSGCPKFIFTKFVILALSVCGKTSSSFQCDAGGENVVDWHVMLGCANVRRSLRLCESGKDQVDCVWCRW